MSRSICHDVKVLHNTIRKQSQQKIKIFGLGWYLETSQIARIIENCNRGFITILVKSKIRNPSSLSKNIKLHESGDFRV
jgi:hypothetical protein